MMLLTHHEGRNQKTKAAPYLLFVLLFLIFYFPAGVGVAADPAPLKEITVVSDDNYPPFIFRDEQGHLQGILVDEWSLWKEKTGIKVDLQGMDWDKAQKKMAEGNAQVIDTIFFTEERAKTLAFSAPYALLDVPIFFHRDISGIKDVNSLHGFTIGVKAGDACIDFLKKHAIRTLREYPSYESIVRDAAEQKIKVFCIDGPPAHYYLYKMNLEQQYRHTAPLYTGQFHRAVHRERKDILKAVEEGFAKISPKEHEEIEKRWRGSPIAPPPNWTYLFYLIGGLLALGAILLLWNHILRRKVTQKTVQLQEAIDNLEKSEEKYRLVVENAEEVILIAQDGLLKYVNPMTVKMLGYSEEVLTSMPFVELIHPEDRERLFEAHIRRLKGEENQPVQQFRVLTSDGSVRWADSHAATISWEGKPATLNIIADVTARKRAEEVIQEEKNLSESIINSLPGIFYLFDAQGKFLRWNRNLEIVGGYSHQEMLERHPSDFFAGKEKELVQQRIRDTFVNGEANVEARLTSRNGTGAPYFLTGVRIEINGQPHLMGMGVDITDRKQAEKQLQDTLESLRKAVGTTIQVISSTVEARDPYTSGHQTRTSDLARAIAMEMGLPREKIEGIRMAGSIHDIGKISIPAEILSKPTKLSKIEFSLIKEHARKGYEMLKNVESPWPLAEIVHQHHERMDGSGYPGNLKGEEILMEARILSVADVVEAMASHRPYRPGLGIDAALQEIEKNSGIFYDKSAAEACLRLFRVKGYQLEGT